MTQSPRKSSANTDNPSRRDSSARFAARIGLMASLALIFSYVEAIIPYSPGVPGIKLGIANIVTVIALYKYGKKDAVCVSVIRIVIAGFLFNGLFGMLYSLAGAAVSLAGMIGLKKTGLFSVVGVSMAAGVLHYLAYDAVTKLISDMAECFPGGLFVFDFISKKGKTGVNTQIKMTKNAARMDFSMEDAEKELTAMSRKVSKVITKSYLEGYPVENVKYSWLTKQYIKSKRDKFFVAHVEFGKGVIAYE